jgi:hypothetical protein
VGSNRDVHLHTWRDGRWGVETVASGYDAADVLQDSQGRVHVLAFEAEGTGLCYAIRDTSGNWARETVESAGLGEHAAVALDSAGRPHFARGNFTDVTYGVRTESGWQVEDVGRADGRPAMALDSQNQPHVGCRRLSTYETFEWFLVQRREADGTWVTDPGDTSLRTASFGPAMTRDDEGTLHLYLPYIHHSLVSGHYHAWLNPGETRWQWEELSPPRGGPAGSVGGSIDIREDGGLAVSCQSQDRYDRDVRHGESGAKPSVDFLIVDEVDGHLSGQSRRMGLDANIDALEDVDDSVLDMATPGCGPGRGEVWILRYGSLIHWDTRTDQVTTVEREYQDDRGSLAVNADQSVAWVLRNDFHYPFNEAVIDRYDVDTDTWEVEWSVVSDQRVTELECLPDGRVAAMWMDRYGGEIVDSGLFLIDETGTAGEDVLPEGFGQIRTITVGADGIIYVLNETDGDIWRLAADGSGAEVFADLPELFGDVVSMTFDDRGDLYMGVVGDEVSMLALVEGDSGEYVGQLGMVDLETRHPSYDGRVTFVPEPAMVALLAVGGLGLLRRRR